MAKNTKEMEYNRLAKYGECFCATSNCGGLGIVVNSDGSGVLWRRYCMDKVHVLKKRGDRGASLFHGVRYPLLSR